MDLHHLVGNLATATGLGRVTDACRDVQRVIDGQEARSPIIAEGHVGQQMAPARGLSIYFPMYPVTSVHYGDLDFAQHTAWGGASWRRALALLADHEAARETLLALRPERGIILGVGQVPAEAVSRSLDGAVRAS